MNYQHLVEPQAGSRIAFEAGKLQVPDQPIIGYIEGDGIGPDIMRACLRIWDAAVAKAYAGKRKVQWMELYLGEKAASLYDGDFFPAEGLAALKDLRVSIKGPLTTPVGGGFRSLNVALRQDLDLYACVRPVRYYPGVPSPLKNPDLVDVVIFRENTEDVYAGIEYQAGSEQATRLEAFLRDELGAELVEGSGLGVKPISAFGTKRLVRKAIQYALSHGRESVTLVHKGNIMKYTEGAFRNWGYELAHDEFRDEVITEEELYELHGGRQPEGKIVIKNRIADIMFQLMLLRPDEFDVIAAPNLNGDYLSDTIAAEVGGVGIAPGANISDEVAVFEATHGTAPKYANQDKANPCSLLFSGVMMFEYLGWTEVADLINRAFPEVIKRKVVTYDFARQMQGATEVSTSAFADALISQIEGVSNLEAWREAQQAVLEDTRRQREARRVAHPEQEMEATGRLPHSVGDIMTRAPFTVPPETLVRDAIHVMREHGISSVLVEANGDGQWGIMTQRDILTRIVNLNRSPAHVSVGEIASKPLITVPVDLPLNECGARMAQKNIRRVVVEQQGVPIGIVSDTDIFWTVEEFGWGVE
jgi:isocitrate dehydrogenase